MGFRRHPLSAEDPKIFKKRLTQRNIECNIRTTKNLGEDREMSVEVKLRKSEPLEKALRRLKKKLDREGVLRDVKAKRYFEKPCETRRQKEKVAAFNNMLRQKRECA